MNEISLCNDCEMVNDPIDDKQINQALKLQELVKAKLKELQLEDMGGSWVMVREGLLENLIEESEK